MLINTDLSADTSMASRQNSRSVTGAATSQTSSATTNSSSASQLGTSLQRLTDIPAGVQDADWEIQDEHGAGQSLETARQQILGQPGQSLAAQANQLSQNVLSLLQLTE